MKAKYSSLVFSLLLLAIMTYASFVVFDKNKTNVDAAVVQPGVNSNLPVINIEKKQLDSIAESLFKKGGQEKTYNYTDLSILGYSPRGHIFQNAKETQKAESQNYQISMSIVFDNNRYCVINDKFYREGDYISDDVIVKTIQSNRVLIKEYGNEKWHDIADGSLQKKEVKNELFSMSVR